MGPVVVKFLDITLQPSLASAQFARLKSFSSKEAFAITIPVLRNSPSPYEKILMFPPLVGFLHFLKALSQTAPP